MVITFICFTKKQSRDTYIQTFVRRQIGWGTVVRHLEQNVSNRSHGDGSVGKEGIVAKPSNLSLIAGTHIVERKNQLL